MNVLIVFSRFNEDVVYPMRDECVKAFREKGIEPLMFEVPGAVEIPLMAKKQIEVRRPDVVVALGCVIRGDTDHYDAVCRMCEMGIMNVMLETGVPIVFEVLMVDDKQKALTRISKGRVATEVAIELSKPLPD